MLEYLEPTAMKFILVTATLAAVVTIADIVLLFQRRDAARLKELLPAVDSILVIAGFMVFTGTGVALVQSAGKMTNITMEKTFFEIAQRWGYSISGESQTYIIKVMATVFSTVLIAWFLFFVFFEAWYFLRFMLRRNMKKAGASS